MSSSSRGNFLSSQDLKYYEVDQDILSISSEEVEDYFDFQGKKRLIKANVSCALRQLQNVLTSRRSSSADLSVSELKEFFKNQHGVCLDPEEFGFKDIEDLLRKLASEEKILLMDDMEEVRISTQFEDDNIVTRENLEKPQEDQKLLQVGHQGLYKVSMVESVSAIWIYNVSQAAERLKMDEELSKFYRSAPQHYQVQEMSQCLVGRLLAASCRHHQIMVRVRVMKVLWAEEKIKVHQVDYGSSDTVAVADLFFLHRKFLSLPALVSKVGIGTLEFLFLPSRYL